MRRPLLVLVVVLLVPPLGAGERNDLLVAGAQIREESLRASMRLLADDLLEGREAGSRGYQLAASYMAARFEALGLEPAGEQGTFFQTVPLRAARVVLAESSAELVTSNGAVSLQPAADLLLSPNFVSTEVALEAPLAFAGYGVIAPELEHDDYKGIDVRGKIVVVLKGGPPSFPHNQRAYYSSTSVKAAAAAERGAVGVLRIVPPEDWETSPWSKSAEHAEDWGMRWYDGEAAADVIPAIEVQATMSASGAEKLFAGAKQPLAAIFEGGRKGTVDPFALPGRLRVRQKTEHRQVESPNVAAMLRGSDQELRSEYVVLTAHLDGIGTGAPVEGDTIFNGAYDNASGCAALLEIARAFRSLPVAPKRSVLFLAVTAEEKGLQGADYFVNSPTVPLDRIVANLNIDMFLALFPVRGVVAFGAEHSSLGGVVERAAARTGFVVRPDHAPEEVVFIRSDQFPFVKKGIPAIFVTSGLESSDAGANELHLERTWLRDIYHTRRDDMSQSFDYDSLVRFARLNFLVGHEVAEAEQRPAWTRGDFFGRKFSGLSD
jgi:hypothetical protein